MRVLVTGGNGNIGKFVVSELLGKGHEVRIFDIKEMESSSVEFIKGSVTEPKEIESAMEGIDAVIHLAAIPSMMPNIPAVEYMNVNVTGTFNVLEASAKSGVGKVAIASSDSALGFVFGTNVFFPDYFPIDENHPLKPQDPYGLSKALKEELCKRATRRYGIKTICLRFCWVWFPQTYALRKEIVKNEHLLNIKRMWGYVDARDIAQACRLAVESENILSDSFFITADDTFADESTIEIIRRDYPVVKNVSDDYLTDNFKPLFDNAKAKKFLGYFPQHSWRENV